MGSKPSCPAVLYRQLITKYLLAKKRESDDEAVSVVIPELVAIILELATLESLVEDPLVESSLAG